MSEGTPPSGDKQVNKPGTSCLGCRRRKLKCTRESKGCQNCTKSDLPCVYPTPEVGVKRKRGPYKKDKPARQRHLEDLVKYLEPKNSSPDGNGQAGEDSSTSGSPGQAAHAGNFPDRTASSRQTARTANSENLVKDALIALTKSSVSDQEARLDDGAFSMQSYMASGGTQIASGSVHPPIRRIFEYWHLFVTRVDPMVKIIHCPTFARKLFNVIDSLGNISLSTEAMLFSIYYSAVSTCTTREARRRFGESRDVLLRRYGQSIEAAFGDNYDIPSLEAVQALVLYIICIHRQDNASSIRSLFSLAVRSAQLIGLHDDRLGKHPPFETELRRRLWFHLCGLENRTAEESGSRATSIMENQTVSLPSNYDDCDMDPRMKEFPEPRAGVTDMTFPLLRYEIHRTVYGLFGIRKRRSMSWTMQEPGGVADIRGEQMEFLEKTKSRLESVYRVHLDRSRPYDWMCSRFIQGMLVKAELIVDFPSGTTPTKDMPASERMKLLKSSVDIIELTHVLAVDERLDDWLWYFRGYVQWHCLAIVVAELGWSNNKQFTDTAWQVLDPILADWDSVYKTKKDDPAWDHVNTLIERARHSRQQRKAHANARKNKRQQSSLTANRQPQFNMCGSPINAQAISPIHEAASDIPQYHASGAAAGESHSQQAPTPQTHSSYTPGSHESGQCAGSGSMMDFDINFASEAFEGLENVDFSAFDQVFGSGSWDFLDPLDDVNMQFDGQQVFMGTAYR